MGDRNPRQRPRQDDDDDDDGGDDGGARRGTEAQPRRVVRVAPSSRVFTLADGGERQVAPPLRRRRLPTRPSIAGVETPRASRPRRGLDSERSAVAPGTEPPAGAVPTTPGARRSERTPPARRTPSTRRRTTATSMRFDARFTTRSPRIRLPGSTVSTPTARWPRWIRAATPLCTSPSRVGRGARC